MIKIRPIRPEEEPVAIAILDRWNMAPRPADADCPDPERSGLDLEHTLVALRGERIVGVCSFIMHSPTLAETASLAVDPSVQGQGVGFQLQQARLEIMRKLGVTTVRTETDRPETIAWYIRKFGYDVVGSNPKKHAFSLKEVDEWTVLELRLD